MIMMLRFMLSTALSLLLLVSCGTLTKSKLDQLQPGDTEQQVLSKLGRPNMRTFDRGVTIWQYVTTTDDVWILEFEEGRLVKLDKQDTATRPREGSYEGRPYYGSYPTGRSAPWFATLLKQIDGALSSNQKTIIERAASMHYFTPEEAAQVINKIPFKSTKLEVLRMLVPTLRYFDDLSPLYEIFPFSDERREIDKLAAEEIQRRRRR